MEELAQAPSSASNLLQTAGQTVDMLRVVSVLNEISDLLKACAVVCVALVFASMAAAVCAKLIPMAWLPPTPAAVCAPQAQLGEGKVDTADLFRDLSAYLTLERAEKEGGFQASSYGLSDRQAADVAVVFNQYDTNQDGKLDMAEMQRLWYVAVLLLHG